MGRRNVPTNLLEHMETVGNERQRHEADEHEPRTAKQTTKVKGTKQMSMSQEPQNKQRNAKKRKRTRGQENKSKEKGEPIARPPLGQGRLVPPLPTPPAPPCSGRTLCSACHGRAPQSPGTRRGETLPQGVGLISTNNKTTHNKHVARSREQEPGTRDHEAGTKETRARFRRDSGVALSLKDTSN